MIETVRRCKRLLGALRDRGQWLDSMTGSARKQDEEDHYHAGRVDELRRCIRLLAEALNGGGEPAEPSLEELLARVPERYGLGHRRRAFHADQQYLAWWHRGQGGIICEGVGSTRAAAIRAATLELLGRPEPAEEARGLPGVTKAGNMIRSEGDDDSA